MMNSVTDQTFVVLPYKIDVEDTGRAIINRIQAELEEGPRKAHFLEIFNLSVVSFAESIDVPEGLSQLEYKRYFQIETTHPAFYNWLAYYITLQKPNKISFILDMYASEKYGPTENFNNAVEFLLVNCLDHVPFDHHAQDEAVVKWVREKNYPSLDIPALENKGQTIEIEAVDAEIIDEIATKEPKKKTNKKKSSTPLFQDQEEITNIGISKDWQGSMCFYFINYLDNEAMNRTTFIDVMKGRHLNPENRIFLNMQANLFCQAIKEMRAPGHFITSTKKRIAKWIHTNFIFMVKGKKQKISESYCLSMLTSDRDAPEVKDRIKIDLKTYHKEFIFEDDKKRP
jgi:hypothetical protein